MLSSTSHSGSDFVLVLAGGTLFLVCALPALWSRLHRRTRGPVVTYRPTARRPVAARLAHSQGIACLHCPARCSTFSEMDLHLKFDCPGLKRRT